MVTKWHVARCNSGAHLFVFHLPPILLNNFLWIPVVIVNLDARQENQTPPLMCYYIAQPLQNVNTMNGCCWKILVQNSIKNWFDIMEMIRIIPWTGKYRQNKLLTIYLMEKIKFSCWVTPSPSFSLTCLPSLSIQRKTKSTLTIDNLWNSITFRNKIAV